MHMRNGGMSSAPTPVVAEPALKITIDRDRLELIIRQALLDQDASTYNGYGGGVSERAETVAAFIVEQAARPTTSDEAIALLRERLSS